MSQSLTEAQPGSFPNFYIRIVSTEGQLASIQAFQAVFFSRSSGEKSKQFFPQLQKKKLRGRPEFEAKSTCIRLEHKHTVMYSVCIAHEHPSSPTA